MSEDFLQNGQKILNFHSQLAQKRKIVALLATALAAKTLVTILQLNPSAKRPRAILATMGAKLLS